MSNTTRRSFLGAAVAILASAVSGFTGKYRGDSASKAPVRLPATMDGIHESLLARFPKTMAWLKEYGWDVELVPDRSMLVCSIVIDRGPSHGVVPWEGGYEAQPSSPEWTEVRFSVSLIGYRKVARTLMPQNDVELLRHVKYEARKALEKEDLVLEYFTPRIRF